LSSHVNPFPGKSHTPAAKHCALGRGALSLRPADA
jgi:hypothetical protein